MKSYFLSLIIILFVFLFQLFAQDFRLAAPGQLNYPVAKSKTTSDSRSGVSVDPSVYLLGPGDAFEIRLSKMPWAVYSGTVNESNVLYIPELGTFNVNKQTLDEAKKAITATVLQQKSRDEIDIILSSPKEVEVVVTGEAVNSGSFRLSGTLRVLDAIKIALKDSMALFGDINFRNIAVTIQGKTSYCDLSGFIAHGEGLENPYLYPGSIISLTPPTKWVTISGAVTSPFPQSIPINPNDTYGHVFRFCRLLDDADTNSILMFRKGQNIVRHTLSTISDVMIEDLDYVIVGSLKSVKRPVQVAIRGEIKNPGTYPLQNGNISSINGILTIAGGVTEKADSSRIYIIRKDPLTQASARLSKELGSQPQKKDPLSQRMITSGDYRIIPMNSISDNALENNDVIVVPEVSHTVYVSGNVNKPGAYPFVKNEPISYYVKLAGGWATMADRRNCKNVTAYGDYWVVKQSAIEAGDIIVVPERPQNQKMQRYDLVIKTLYYVGTSILAFISIGKALDLIRDE